MAEESASNLSTSTNDSAASDKTQPSPSRATTTPLNASASGWPTPTGSWIPTQTGTSWGPQPSWAPPQNTIPSTWPMYGLLHNYTHPYAPAPQGGYAVRNNPVYSSVPSGTQQTPQGWYPPPQGGIYGYSNSSQFGIYGAGNTLPSFGVYNL
ncbi:hypothetical protein PIB30_015095 [Stylosanthes scabra]|uniref:Uncharacterized protein n=1 Tax=Stylosanthes scabra TaxID=79078 RepID=A0ABU6R772_9FABA|nr:hypothetical protein [Stylosanthes scabra]